MNDRAFVLVANAAKAVDTYLDGHEKCQLEIAMGGSERSLKNQESHGLG